MRRSSTIVWIMVLALFVAGCRQGAGTAASGPTEPNGSPRGSVEPTTKAERTTAADALECAGGMSVSGVVDYAPGAKGKKATPQELARRQFSKKIEERDEVVPVRGQNPGTVHVIRNGRVVAVIYFRRAGGGWLYDHYDACSDF